MNLKIKNAIIYYNDYVRKDGEPKMTQKSLALSIMPDERKDTASHNMTQWANGKKTIKLCHLIRACIQTGVDPNFLCDWETINKNEKLLNNEK